MHLLLEMQTMLMIYIELNTVPETASQLYNWNKYRQNSLSPREHTDGNICVQWLFMHGKTPV